MRSISAFLIGLGIFISTPPYDAPCSRQTAPLEQKIDFNSEALLEDPNTRIIKIDNEPLDLKIKNYLARHKINHFEKKIVIDKSDYQLDVYVNNHVIKSYIVALGYNSLDDKVMRGSRKHPGHWRTPEGEFYIATKNLKSKYHKFLGISYPNIEDAERGLKDGLINQNQYERIVKAIKEGKLPLWNTRLGGRIGIHGGGIGLFEGDKIYIENWTWGCIALQDKDVDEIFDYVELGTPVMIKK